MQELNDPEDDVVTRDADALQAVFKEEMRRIKTDEVRTAKANKLSLQAAVRAAGMYATQELSRWESRPGTALATRKRPSKKATYATGDDGDEWKVVTGARRARGNTLVLRKLCQGQASGEIDE